MVAIKCFADLIPILPGRFLGFSHPKGEVHILSPGKAVSCPGKLNIFAVLLMSLTRGECKETTTPSMPSAQSLPCPTSSPATSSTMYVSQHFEVPLLTSRSSALTKASTLAQSSAHSSSFVRVDTKDIFISSSAMFKRERSRTHLQVVLVLSP